MDKYAIEYDRPARGFPGWRMRKYYLWAKSDAEAIEKLVAFVERARLTINGATCHVRPRNVVSEETGRQLPIPWPQIAGHDPQAYKAVPLTKTASSTMF